MDNPQYFDLYYIPQGFKKSFKPYYKWITLNTYADSYVNEHSDASFKPYYKWITLNTDIIKGLGLEFKVLNLIING